MYVCEKRFQSLLRMSHPWPLLFIEGGVKFETFVSRAKGGGGGGRKEWGV